MSNITRTIYGAARQTEMLLGLPHRQIPNSTLNERFDVFPDVEVTNNSRFAMRYLGIGVGGHRYLQGAEGIPYPDLLDRDPREAAAYRPIPFIMREVGNDLSPSERGIYAMRRAETHNGVNYICYYLRRWNFSQAQVSMILNTPVQSPGNTSPPTYTQTPFVPTNSELNPVPAPVPPTGSASTDGSYLSASAMLGIGFTAAEVAELLNVGRILWDNERAVVVSEFQLVGGYDQIVTSNIGGATVSYNEALMATVMAHVGADYTMASLTRGLDHILELGAIEPLMVITSP